MSIMHFITFHDMLYKKNRSAGSSMQLDRYLWGFCFVFFTSVTYCSVSEQHGFLATYRASSTPTVSARALPLPSHPTQQAATDPAPLPLWGPQLPAADLLRHAAGGKEPTGASRPCSSHLIYPDTSLNVPELPRCHSGWRVLASVPMSMGSG